MGHSEDAVYKIPHKNENALAELAENFRYWFKLILYRIRYKNIEVLCILFS